MTFEIILRNFRRGLWNERMVAFAVEKGVLLPQEYKEITGKDYFPRDEVGV